MKIVRPSYPLELSIGVLILIFGMAFFLSGQVFAETLNESSEGMPVYVGMFLVSCAVVIMVVVLWEEFLFPIRIKPTDAGAEFRNHRNKLKIQVLIYCLIPFIFVFIYLTYEVEPVRFFIWAAICIVMPLIGKLISGIRNYNDFLRLTYDVIEFKNNEKTGLFLVKDVKHITLVRDQRGALHRILVSTGGQEVEIDIDEMELEAYCVTIDEFMRLHYGGLVRLQGARSGSQAERPVL